MEFRLPEALEHHIVLQRVVQNQTVLVPVLGDVGQAQAVALPDGGMGDILAVQIDFTGGHFFQPCQSIYKLRLAVAFDTGQADNFTLTNLQAGIFYRIVAMHPGGNRHVLYPQDDLTGGLFLFVGNQLHIPAHHQAGHLLYRSIGHLYGAHVFALTQDGAAIGHGLDFRQLVGDEEDGLPLFLKRAHDFHQLVNLLGGEDGGGLIENQDFIVPVQHFQDFHPLLHTHGDILDFGIRVNLQAVPLGELHHPLPGCFSIHCQSLGGLCAQDNIVQHGKALHQLKVLVHHADVQGRGIVGVVDFHNLAVLFDNAGFRLVQAKQDAHQRGFTGTVFAQKRMDFPPAQLEGNIVIGLDAREFLGDVQHLDYVVCHTVTPIRV